MPYNIEKLTSDMYAAGMTFGQGTKKVTPSCVAAIEALKASIVYTIELEDAVDKLRDAFYLGTLVGSGLDPVDARADLANRKNRPPDVQQLLNVAKVHVN
jgi:hypothetical protein